MTPVWMGIHDETFDIYDRNVAADALLGPGVLVQFRAVAPPPTMAPAIRCTRMGVEAHMVPVDYPDPADRIATKSQSPLRA